MRNYLAPEYKNENVEANDIVTASGYVQGTNKTVYFKTNTVETKDNEGNVVYEEQISFSTSVSSLFE